MDALPSVMAKQAQARAARRVVLIDGLPVVVLGGIGGMAIWHVTADLRTRFNR